METSRGTVCAARLHSVFPAALLKKRTIAGVKGVPLRFVALVARSSVTQKPTRFVISCLPHDLR
jgi:hypothetical protein